MLGKTEGKRRGEQQWMGWLDRITDSVDMYMSKVWEVVKDRGVWCAAVRGVAKSQTWLSNWTTTTKRSELGNVPRIHIIVENEEWWNRMPTVLRTHRIGELGGMGRVFNLGFEFRMQVIVTFICKKCGKMCKDLWISANICPSMNLGQKQEKRMNLEKKEGNSITLWYSGRSQYW